MKTDIKLHIHYDLNFDYSHSFLTSYTKKNLCIKKITKRNVHN